jgi:hypothetical protein
MGSVFQQPVIVNVPQEANAESAVRQQALSEKQSQLVRVAVDLESRRTSLRAALQAATGPERGSLAQELREAEQQLAGVNASLAETRAQLKELGQLPVVASPTVPPPIAITGELAPGFAFPDNRMFGYSQDEFVGGVGFILLLPLVLAFARLLWRRGNMMARAGSTESDARLERLEQAVESVAIEVERIGESQRYTARLLSERQPEFNPATAGESARPAGDVRR